MNYAMSILKKERENIVLTLKNGEKERLEDLKQIDNALQWLNFVEQKQLGSAKKYDAHILSDIIGHGMAFYRIAIDNETDDMTYWEEYCPDGKTIELTIGDVLLFSKNYKI